MSCYLAFFLLTAHKNSKLLMFHTVLREFLNQNCTFADSLRKRELEDSVEGARNFLEDKIIPQGSLCINQDSCSFIEFCDTSGLKFHCRLTTWFLVTIVVLAIILIISVLLSCACCPCCCLYALCRKK